MKKTNSASMFSKYSDAPVRKNKNSKEMPLMTTYEQRYKGTSSMSKELTEPKAKPTLDEKIKMREAVKEEPKSSGLDSRVSVEIAGHNYLLGSNDAMSETKIRRIASMVNVILSNAKEDNPGLTNMKVTTLALIDACDRIITLQDENSNYKTELMYLQSKLKLEDSKKVKEPTPMEILANEEEDIDEES